MGKTEMHNQEVAVQSKQSYTLLSPLKFMG